MAATKNMTNEKPWFKSKGKWGGLLVAIGGLLTAGGGYFQGTVDPNTLAQAIQTLIAVGMGLGLLGIRARQDKEAKN